LIKILSRAGRGPHFSVHCSKI